MAHCPTCKAPVTLAPDGDPRYIKPKLRQREVDGLRALLMNRQYVSLRARYDTGQLSFYGQIAELEREHLGCVLTS